MTAQTGTEPFDSEDWVFEIKWDGYRAIADLKQEDAPQLYSRNGLDFSQKFKKIYQAVRQQPYRMVLDGEIVAFDDTGKPNFQWLQQYGDRPDAALQFQVFDLLWLNGHSTEGLTLLQRKELLKDALQEDDLIRYCDHIPTHGKDFFAQVKQMGLEGIMAKKAASVYRENQRSGDWLKLKINQTDEAIVCGYTAPSGARLHFGSLILGKWTDGKLVFAGQAGTGFTDRGLTELYQKMQPYVTTECPFSPIPKTNAAPTWLRPELIAEIKYTEVTADGQFRHPVFLHLREDKDAEELKEESTVSVARPDVVPIQKSAAGAGAATNEIGGQKVRITNPQKIYFPQDGITKGQIIDYYRSIAKYILPHLQDRPQSMNRFPNGIEGLSFYQKDAGEDTPPWVHLEQVFSESNEKYIQYIICNDEQTLVYLANLGCIEMNVWTARYHLPENPDYLVLDLDPSDGNTFEDVIETALVIRDLLQSAAINAYPKTSGSSGIHIYLPTGGSYTYEQVKNFGHLLMQLVQERLPNLTTLERSLQKRDKNKIYLDYLQNRHGQTLASVYSVRPKPGAPVSMALQWQEVKPGLRPTDWNIYNAPERLNKEGDLFLPVLHGRLDMLGAIEKLSK